MFAFPELFPLLGCGVPQKRAYFAEFTGQTLPDLAAVVAAVHLTEIRAGKKKAWISWMGGYHPRRAIGLTW